MRERAMGSEFRNRKSDGVRVHHDKSSDGVRAHHERKSNGVTGSHQKEQRGESLPQERAMG